MKGLTLKKASLEEMQLIISLIDEFNLDDEKISKDQFIVAKKDGELIGFGRLKPYKKIFELSSVGVIEKHRRKGVGRLIINKLIENCPHTDIWITTKIQDYFKRIGFKKCHTPPIEILTKQNYLCRKLKSDINKTHCMLFNKGHLNPVIKVQKKYELIVNSPNQL